MPGAYDVLTAVLVERAGFGQMVSFEQFEAIVDTPKYREMESKYAVH